MPLITCPECGAQSYTRRKHIGQTVRCPKCPARFVAAAPLINLRQWIKGTHPAGAILGGVLLTAAAGLFGLTLLAMRTVKAPGIYHKFQGETAIGLIGLDTTKIALALTAVGLALIWRWRQALANQAAKKKKKRD